ncbi:hypothetical protein ACNOYE_08380 [Nannocystaceae bacterium ST9]
MRSLPALFGTLALALALGSLVVGHLLLIPALAGDTSLIDANLARTLAEPLAMKCATLLLIACALLAIVVKPWLKHTLGLSVSLVAVAIAALDRLVLLPRLQAAWARVDLVAGRPVERVSEAQELQQTHEIALILVLVGLVGLAMLATLKRANSAGT